jgi:hypothetical protein
MSLVAPVAELEVAILQYHPASFTPQNVTSAIWEGMEDREGLIRVFLTNNHSAPPETYRTVNIIIIIIIIIITIPNV